MGTQSCALSLDCTYIAVLTMNEWLTVCMTNQNVKKELGRWDKQHRMAPLLVLLAVHS